MKSASLVVLVLAPLALLGCKDKGPCTGGGMVVDEREVSPVLKDLIGPGAGAMCRDERDSSANATTRHYEIPNVGPLEAVELWDQHMTNKGWFDVTTLPMLTENLEGAREGDGCGLLTHLWGKAGKPDRVQISVSFCVEDKGWSTITHHDCSEPNYYEHCK